MRRDAVLLDYRVRLGNRLCGSHERRQRRDDRIGIAEEHDRPAPVCRLLDAVIDVGGERAAPTNDGNSRRQVERQRARTMNRAVGAVLALHHRIFHPHDGRGRDLVVGRLVAAAELRRAPEQVALDEVVSRLARAQFLSARRRARRHIGLGELVLVGAPAGCEIGDHQHEQGQSADQRNHGPVELAHGRLNAALRVRLHY